MPDMQQLMAPNAHPVFVHFTYALVTLSALSLFLVSLQPRGGWRDTLKNAGDWMLAFGALAAIATVAAGFQAFYSVAHDDAAHAAMTTHRNWALPTAAVVLALAVSRYAKRAEKPGILFAALLLGAAGLLTVTAWWGGRLVYRHGLGVEGMHEAETPGHQHTQGPGEDQGGAAEESGHEHAPGEEHPSTEHVASPEAQDLGTAADAAAAAGAASSGLSAAYPETPVAVVEAFAQALKSGNAATVERLLAPDVLIAEGGGAERSFAEYASHHMPADMEFAKAVATTVKDRRVIDGVDMAAVVTSAQTHGTFRGKSVRSRMMETVVLRKIDGRWRIAHIHWSSSPITGEDEH
jgi:uncharacterized membrane protein/ketosteroid isomerase-like protein